MGIVVEFWWVIEQRGIGLHGVLELWRRNLGFVIVAVKKIVRRDFESENGR